MRRSVFQNPGKLSLRFAAFSVLLFLALSSCAAVLPIQSYSTSDGLAHDRVNRIVKDSRGFLWFCTAEGLSRFDGYEFKNYTEDDGLPHRAIYDFLETRAGEFWMATGNGVVLFNPLGNPKSGAPLFRSFRPADLKTDAKLWSVRDLMEDRDGRVWAASSSGIYRLQKTDEWLLERFEIASPSHDFSSLLEERSGAIWAGAEIGLFRISADRSDVRTVNGKMRVESLLEDRAGQIWVGSAGGGKDEMGLHLFSAVGDEPRRIRVFGKGDGLSDDLWINSLLETTDGRIFVGVANGLCEYAPQTDASRPQFRVLSDEKIIALGEDSGGGVWFSTNSRGVSRLARPEFVKYDGSQGLGSGNIKSIISTVDGETFILSDAFKIHRSDGEKFLTIAPLGMIQGNWGTGQITFPDRTGAWWVAGVSGLQRYPPVKNFEDLANTRPLKTYTTRDGLFNNDVFQLFEDSRGDIWITVIGDVNSLLRWERAADRIHGYTTADNLPSNNGAVAFSEDRAGNVWFGFYYGGLSRFRGGKFESFTAEDGLPSGLIGNIFTDSKGRVWVATSSGGVLRIDNPTSEEKPRLVNLTTRDGLSSNQATCVTEDKFGRIYIATGRGVNRLDLPTGRIKVFTKADGLPENIVRLCKRDANGALWFGTAEGLARFVPVAEEYFAPPTVFLSNLRVNGETVVKFSELGETSVINLEFAPDQRQIQIDFFAPSFTTAENLRYQYRLEGFDADWSEPSPLKTVNLNLSAGTYRFLVRAVNSNGAVSENPAFVSFSIARPIWQRWWFLLTAVFAFSLLIYALYRSRVAQLLRLERVRTRIATDLHDDIGASLSKIAILSEVVRQKVGDKGANEPLDLISDTSRELVDSMSDIVWAINPKRDRLRDLTGRMRNLASELAELADINLRFDLKVVEAEGGLPLGADMRREIYLIFKETVNNLVKHSACRKAEIEFRLETNEFVFIVKDDGHGFDPSQNIGNGKRGGNGLLNMRRRAENLGGKYQIESGAKGTTATLRVPVKNQGFGLKRFFSR